MKDRTRRAWHDLLSAEAPASLAPPLFSARGRRRSTRVPIPVWQRARGAWVWDTEGRRYLDFVAGFGVASLGHSHPRVVAAVRRQARLLVHGYGDVHPHELRARLAGRLARLGPWPATRVLWAQNGSEAVELAWKTAALATGRPGVLAFEGGYHGESVGALSLTGWPELRAPFETLLPRRAIWAPFAPCLDPVSDGRGSSCDLSCVDEAFARADRFHARGPGLGAVLIEPIQGRGGVIVPPPGHLKAIERQARRRGWLLIADEVFTGLGRTGKRFAFEHERIRPDLICIGKSLAGGLPLAAVLGRASVMRAWRRAVAGGEAPHSSTFLAHPLACAAALAALEVLEQDRLASRAARLGRRLQSRLSEVLGSRPRVSGVRGRGLLVGFEISRPGGQPDPRAARAVVEAALGERLLVLTAGRRGNVISLSPSLTIGERLLFDGIDRLARALRKALAWG